MRTPYGMECKYFYGNYFRGRKQEVCRLIGNVPPPHQWESKLCRTCPVPRILLANECENMVLSGTVENKLLGLKKQVEIKAYCEKSQQVVEQPEIGCGQCHPLPSIYLENHE